MIFWAMSCLRRSVPRSDWRVDEVVRIRDARLCGGDALNPFIWERVTSDRHVASVDGVVVCSVERRNRLRADGTKRSWRIVVLNDPHTWSRTFCNHDPLDLESTKSAAEARTRWVIGVLYVAVNRRSPLLKLAKKSAKKPAKKSVEKHDGLGNCDKHADCLRCGFDNVCNVCHVHEQPRGECDGCPRCPACAGRLVYTKKQARITSSCLVSETQSRGGRYGWT